MANTKKSFVLYHDIRKPLELLADDERGKLFLAILDYSEKGISPEFQGALAMAFAFIKAAIDRDTEVWEDKRAKRVAAGSLGGKQKVANQANAIFTKQSETGVANQAVPVPASVTVSIPVNNIPYGPQKGAEEVEAAFDEFWAIYPRKVGKVMARKVFEKLSPEIWPKLAPAIKLQCRSDQWQKENGKFIPNPSTWLNQGRWDDELQGGGPSDDGFTRY